MLLKVFGWLDWISPVLITARSGFVRCKMDRNNVTIILRPTHLLESHVSGQMLKKEETEEGEADPFLLKLYLSLACLFNDQMKG